jgi:rhamnose transport system substrate-binding protein
MGEREVSVAVLPKLLRNEYFENCRKGVEEAGRALGAKLVWDGPSSADAEQQAGFVRKCLAGRPDAIAVSAEDASVVSRALREARQAGIKVLTWDSDAEPDARDFFVNPAPAEGIADAISTEAARILRGRGQVAILTATLTSPNQRRWIALIEERLRSQYPGIELVGIRPTNEDVAIACREAEALMREHPKLGGILALCAPAVPGAAEATKRAGRRDVRVVGMAAPSACRSYLQEGWIESVVLWNTVDLGYLVVTAAVATVLGDLKAGDTFLRAGRLGNIIVRADEVRLGRPHIFNKASADRAGF